MLREDSTHGVGVSLEVHVARATAWPRRAERATPAPQAREGTPSPRWKKKKGYTTTKLRLPAAAPQPRVRLEGPEVAAEDLRRERDARL